MKVLAKTCCAFVLLLMPSLVSAATIAPSTIELQGSRGDVVEAQFSILNTGTSDQTYYLDQLGFGPTDETGTPKFFEVEENNDALANWIQFLFKEVTVPAQTAVDVPFSVVLPDDIPSGGYYAALTVSNAPADVIASNGAIIEAKTAILVLFTVEGETIEEMAILDLETPADGLYGTYTYRVQNQGNVHVTPTGELTFTGMYGSVFHALDANPDEGRVLPDSTRSYEVEFANDQAGYLNRAWHQLTQGSFGIITVELGLMPGEVRSAEIGQVTVIPWELLTTMLGGALLLIGIFILKRRR